MSISKPKVSCSMGHVIVPRLQELGFAVMSPANNGKWNDCSYFSRRSGEGREQIIMIGRDKFGGALGVLVGRQRPDGSFEYTDWMKAGLNQERLEYRTQKDL